MQQSFALVNPPKTVVSRQLLLCGSPSEWVQSVCVASCVSGWVPHKPHDMLSHRFWLNPYVQRNNDGIAFLFHLSATGLSVDFVVPRQVPSEEDSMKQVAAKSA